MSEIICYINGTSKMGKCVTEAVRLSKLETDVQLNMNMKIQCEYEKLSTFPQDIILEGRF